MLLSIVIPTKNEEKNLPLLLESIKTQSFKDYEIIVADAGSTDRTREIAESYGARVVPGSLPGPGRNRGAEVAKGTVILFLDADVVLEDAKFLEDNLKEMERKGADVATCKVKPLAGKLIDRTLHQLYDAYAIGTERILPHAPGFCIFAKKRVHDQIGGFSENLHFAEDHDYVQRAEKAGHKFRILRSHPIVVSIRRVEKDGRLATAVRYAKAEALRLATGNYRNVDDYVMGGDVFNKQDE